MTTKTTDLFWMTVMVLCGATAFATTACDISGKIDTVNVGDVSAGNSGGSNGAGRSPGRAPQGDCGQQGGGGQGQNQAQGSRGGGGNSSPAPCNVNQAQSNALTDGEGEDEVSFPGLPHRINCVEGAHYIVIDRNGHPEHPREEPFADGHAVKETSERLSDFEDEYVECFKTMAPIRDVLMYAPYSVTDAQWRLLTAEFRAHGIKQFSIKLGNMRDWLLSNDDILVYARENLGRRSRRPIERYLQQAELALKCQRFESAGINVPYCD